MIVCMVGILNIFLKLIFYSLLMNNFLFFNLNLKMPGCFKIKTDLNLKQIFEVSMHTIYQSISYICMDFLSWFLHDQVTWSLLICARIDSYLLPSYRCDRAQPTPSMSAPH